MFGQAPPRGQERQPRSDADGGKSGTQAPKKTTTQGRLVHFLLKRRDSQARQHRKAEIHEQPQPPVLQRLDDGEMCQHPMKGFPAEYPLQ